MLGATNEEVNRMTRWALSGDLTPTWGRTLKHEAELWALVDDTGKFSADKCGVLLWPRRKDVPCGDGERAVRVRVTVSEAGR